MNALRIVGMLMILVPILLVGTACGHQEEHGAGIRVEQSEEGSGWLGVSIIDMTSSRAKEKDLKTTAGALVRDVTDGTPADSAGIKEGDIIVEFNGKAVEDASDLSRAVRKIKPGTAVTLAVMRNDERKSLKATIGKSPNESRVRVFRVPHPPRMPRFGENSSAYGLSLMELNQQLGEYFEAPGGKGVLVERVKRNSEGEKAGFKAGDVIIKVGKETIADVDDIWESLEDYKEGETANVEVLRKGTHKALTLTVNGSDHDSGFMFHFNGEPFWNGMKDMKIEIPNMEQLDDIRIDSDHLKRQMDELKMELQKIPKNIREEMKGLREKIRDAVSKAKLSRSV